MEKMKEEELLVLLRIMGRRQWYFRVGSVFRFQFFLFFARLIGQRSGGGAFWNAPVGMVIIDLP